MMFIYSDYIYDFSVLSILGLILGFVGVALVGMSFSGFFNNDENKNKRRPPSKKNPVSKNEDKTNCLILEQQWRKQHDKFDMLFRERALLEKKKEVLEHSSVLLDDAAFVKIGIMGVETEIVKKATLMKQSMAEISSLQNKIFALDSSMTVDILSDRYKNDADGSLLFAEIQASVDIVVDIANIAADAKAAFDDAAAAEAEGWSWTRIIILSSGVILVVAGVIRKVIEHITN